MAAALVVFAWARPAAAAPFAYVPNSLAGNASVIDVATNTVVATVPGTGTNPAGIAVDPAGAFVYLADLSASTVSVISTATNTVVASIPINLGSTGIALNPAGTRLYVAKNLTFDMDVVDTATRTVIATVPLAGSSRPWGVAVDSTGTRAYVTDSGLPRVYVVDTTTNTMIGTLVTTNPQPYAVAVNGAGTFAYVSHNAGGISVFNLGTGALVTTMPTTFFGIRGIALNAAGTRLYAANFAANAISVYDLTTNTLIADVPAGTRPLGVSLDPTGAFVYAINVGSNNVTVMDTATNTVVATVPVGASPAAFGNFVGGAAAPPAAPAVSLAPAVLSFAGQAVSTTSPSQSVTLTNTGTATLNVSSVTVSGDFAVSTGCVGAIAAGGTCTITATFTPIATGARTGQISVASDATGSPHTVGLSGLGLAPASPGMLFTPSSVTFLTSYVGSVSDPHIVTLQNTGRTSLGILGIGVASPDFHVTHNCGASLAPGATCMIFVVFQPTAAGVLSANVQVVTGLAAGPGLLPLIGTATPAPVGVIDAPAAVSFDDQMLGTTSAARAVTLRNTGSADIAVSLVSAQGDFAVSGQDACAVIAPGTACTLGVSFRPTALGDRVGQVVVQSNASSPSVAIALQGRGVPAPTPVLATSATSFAFGNVLLVDRRSMPLELSNTGTADLAITALDATPGFSAEGTCAGRIAPGGRCRLDVTFQPLLPGARRGVLRVSSNAPGAPLEIELSGRGCILFSLSRAHLGAPECGP